MKSIAAICCSLALSIYGTNISEASARSTHHHRHAASHAYLPSEGRSAVRDPDRFYPNEIEGGVGGNLPFNNQLRKLSDPLNANGGGA